MTGWDWKARRSRHFGYDFDALTGHAQGIGIANAELEKVKVLKLAGIFKTISEGHDPGTPNCFLFPLPNGAWRVYRFHPGTTEADTWTQDD